MYKLRQFIIDLTGIVKSEYELTDEEFESGHSECATDARIVVVGVLVREGWNEGEICSALGWSQQRVNWLKNHWDGRMKRRGFKLMWDSIVEFLQ
jgi:hypothetical protein